MTAALAAAMSFSPAAHAGEDAPAPATIELPDPGASRYPWNGPLPENPDWGGITRDTAYFLGWQFAVIGVLYVMPESISQWSTEDKSNYSIDKWKYNTQNPVWDEDKWYINYILHPYWGATYYTRARERGLDRTDSFLTSVLWSTLYEYGAEAFFEPVSKQDLVITPVVGSLIGEYWFAPLRERIRAKPGGPDGWDKTVLVLTDPFGFLNAWADGVLGVKTDIRLQRSSMAPRDPAAVASGAPVTQEANKIWNLSLRAEW